MDLRELVIVGMEFFGSEHQPTCESTRIDTNYMQVTCETTHQVQQICDLGLNYDGVSGEICNTSTLPYSVTLLSPAGDGDTYHKTSSYINYILGNGN